MYIIKHYILFNLLSETMKITIFRSQKISRTHFYQKSTIVRQELSSTERNKFRGIIFRAPNIKIRFPAKVKPFGKQSACRRLCGRRWKWMFSVILLNSRDALHGDTQKFYLISGPRWRHEQIRDQYKHAIKQYTIAGWSWFIAAPPLMICLRSLEITSLVENCWRGSSVRNVRNTRLFFN